MEPKFDFSKQEDQEKFNKLPREEKDGHVEQSQEKAELINELITHISSGDIDGANVVKKYIEEKFPEKYEEIVQLPEVQQAAFEGIKKSLGEEFIGTAKKIQETFPIPQEMLESSEIQQVAFEKIKKWLSEGYIDGVKKIQETFPIPQERLQQILIEITQNDELGILFNEPTLILIDLFGENFMPTEYQDENLEYIENVQNYYSNKEKENVEDLEGEEKYKNIFENLKNLKDTVWDSEGQNHEIASAFESGAEVFGYEKMFKFIGTHDRHDALYAFDQVVKLYEKSGLDSRQFFGQILHQVRMDSSMDTVTIAGEYWQNEFEEDYYEEESVEQIDAYQKLNILAQNFENIDFEEVLQKAQKYRDISSMDKLLNEIQSTQDFFTNWKTLKKFGDMIDLLNQSEVLDELKKLPEDKKELKEYIEALIFHPNISTTAVLNFWRNTDEFLDIYEEHASRTHELKKPSNYTHIPYLQLNAKDLRDALVEGDLNKIQGFASMEMGFAVPVDSEILNLSLVEMTKKALGSFREKIQRQAQNPGKLFSEVQKLFKEEKINLKDFLAGKAELSDETSEQLKDLLLNSESGLKLKTKEYRAKISDKSDPDGVVAGNDTACCMPFGSGKNNVYMYNPNCGQFVIQEKSEDKWKTIAQSVLTKDVDIKMSIPEIVEAASSGHRSMSEIATDEILQNQKEIIVCDNIEVTPNIGNSRDALEVIYREFFKQYLAHTGSSDNLEQDSFLVGLGYNDLVFGNSIDNTFLPTAPVGYSDNVGEKTKQIDLSKDTTSAVFSNIIKQSDAQKEKRELQKGINELTFEDTLKVSYIEGKAYHDNQSLMEYMHNMENGLIAKDIYNAKNDRPNMSFSYTDDSGKMKGYLFAYEGVMNDEDVIYVSDLAALPDAKMAGGKLIGTFLQEYKKQYLDKEDFRSISAHARDKTSYRILEKQLNKLGKKIGVKFEMEELGSRFEGDDEMHEIIIRVKE